MSADQKTVLVVDDNAATRYSTSHILNAAGYRVLAAASGYEGLEMARRENVDVIVLDINLPDKDGFQVCRELRTFEETRRTPVIYLSASFVDDLDKIQGIDAGADGYLTHPVEPPVLLATVRALLRAREAERAVEFSEQRFTAMFEHALNGIAFLSEDQVFIDVNPSFCRMLGRDRDVIVGRHLSAFSPKEHQRHIDAMSASLKSTGEWRGTAPLLNARGEHVELEWSVSLHAVPHVRLAMVSDITARMVIEADRARLLASERLARVAAEEANRLKDDFLAALSHELRTPLNAIVGFSRLLQRLPVVTGDPQVLSSVNAIERNAWVQAQLISDLLDISRITSGKLQLDRQSLSAADAVESALATIQAAARAKKVVINAELDRSTQAIWWDPSRFQQVVWNLVDNAVKFSPIGGVVDVRLRQTPTVVELEVADRGRGISPSFLPHVFDRFRQEDSTSRRGHGGLGLGLAIVHQLVTAHGGTITAASEGEGRGATFLVRMPRTPQSEATLGEISQSGGVPDLRGCRILIVDDNDDARTVLREMLTDASARVADVATAEAAIEALDSFDPHVLVSDLAMPEQDGFDLIRHLRANGWPADRLPAVALSAYAHPDDERRALQAGYQAHVGKPPEVERFLRQVLTLAMGRAGAKN